MPGNPTARPLFDADRFEAVLFDMDGVVTETAEAHADAWQQTFDPFLARYAEQSGTSFRPFSEDDYLRYVDGKPRCDGVRSFLASRGIELPEGSPRDPEDRETIHGLGVRKNRFFREWLATHRVRTYESTVALIHTLRELGVSNAVFSSSRNSGAVLENARVADIFDAKVDGRDMDELGLRGKPDPAILFEAARRLGVSAAGAALVEDSLAGVEAGASGDFSLVIGIDRKGDSRSRQEFIQKGADWVVNDVSQIRVQAGQVTLSSARVLPDAREQCDELRGRLQNKPLAVFLDYDGTLTPIVADRNKAFLSDSMRETLAAVAARYPAAVISGRDLGDIESLVGLDNIYYAGSHGFEISGPGGYRHTVEKAQDFLPELDRAEKALRETLTGISGLEVERKAFDIAVHYRQVDDNDIPELKRKLQQNVEIYPALRTVPGKRVYQIQPRTDWDKGRAIECISKHMGLQDGTLPLYIGDDVTDEAALRVIQDDGIGILVLGEHSRLTAARYTVPDTGTVEKLLDWIAQRPGDFA